MKNDSTTLGNLFNIERKEFTQAKLVSAPAQIAQNTWNIESKTKTKNANRIGNVFEY